MTLSVTPLTIAGCSERGRWVLSNCGAERADRLQTALDSIARLGSGAALSAWIAQREHSLRGLTRETAQAALQADGVTPQVMEAALLVKAAGGQINVIVHTVGILVSLPHILTPGEAVEGLSLGAGNTGRAHDLETDLRVAEFKFIEWRGGPESIRQNGLFIDLFNLASADTSKRRVLYIVGKEHPVRFLENRRALSSVLSKDAATAARFKERHGGTFRTVRDYYESVRDIVEIVDLRDVVPAFSTSASALLN